MAFAIPPVKNVFPLTTLFGQVDSSHANPHGGMDFACPVGTQVCAPSAGTVSRKFYEEDGAGNALEITHPSGVKTLYFHLSSYNTAVGQKVNAGDVVALSGGAKGAAGAGHSTGPHLHWEVRDLNNNKLDPLKYLPGVWNLSANLAKLLGKTTVRGGVGISAGVLLVAAAGGYLWWRRRAK